MGSIYRYFCKQISFFLLGTLLKEPKNMFFVLFFFQVLKKIDSKSKISGRKNKLIWWSFSPLPINIVSG